MLKVLLVDDEAAVTNSLQYGINWDSLGLTVASVAENGIQALEYIQNNHVDIVITDIRMADLDGLSLSQQIFQMDLNIQVIIISGFAEFSYAQKALSYGVIGYCLKPIEYAELTRYLHLAIQRLGGTDTNSFCDDLLDALHQADEEETLKYLKMLGFSSDRYYVAASVSKKSLFSTNSTNLTLQIGHKRYGYISPCPFWQNEITSIADRSECSGFSHTLTSVPVRKLGAALKRQSNVAFQFFFEPERKLFTDDLEPHHSPQTTDFAKCIEARDQEHVIAMLREIQQMSPHVLNISYAWHLYNIIAADDLYGSLVGVDDIYSPEQLVFRFGTFQQMIDIICTRLEEVPSVHDQDHISNTAFLHMVKYVDTHLTEGCSLQQLAKEMNMNANYLGQIFKRETGKTYSTYVTELRIERAKQMLQSGEMSISDIAVSLGFNDYFYFLKTFKRVAGVTPKQYRQGMAHDYELTGFLTDPD